MQVLDRHFNPPETEGIDSPLPLDTAGEVLEQDESMTRVFLGDPHPQERNALRLLLQDLDMEVVGEASSWAAVHAGVRAVQPDMLLLDLSLLPAASDPALAKLRSACPTASLVILMSHADSRQQARLAHLADAFISKDDPPERVAERLRLAAAKNKPSG